MSCMLVKMSVLTCTALPLLSGHAFNVEGATVQFVWISAATCSESNNVGNLVVAQGL